MRKSFICIFMVFVFVITLSFSVYADLPDDDIPQKISVNDFFLYADGTTFLSSQEFNFNSGRIVLFDITHPEGIAQFGYKTTINIDISTPADIYFLVQVMDSQSLVSSLVPVQYTNLTQQIVYDKNMISDFVSYQPFSFSGPFNLYSGICDLSSNKIKFSYSTTSTKSSSLIFGKLSVPIGQQSLTLESNFHSTEGHSIYPFGIFIDYLDSGDPIIDYTDGFLSFDQASDLILSNMDSVLNDPDSSDFEKQFAVSIADQDLARLQSVSDSKYSGTVNSFSDTSSDIVNSFVSSGSIDVAPFISQLNSSFADCLTQAVTSEQGILINSLYNVRLSEIQAVFDANYAAALDDVISVEDFQHKQEVIDRTEELIHIEEETLQIFKDSEYSSYLVFQDWISSIPDDYVLYLSFFDFLLEDPRTSILQPFIIIPISLVLVGILLSTTTVVLRRR